MVLLSVKSSTAKGYSKTMENMLHLVKSTSYATFEVLFAIEGDVVKYVGKANGEVMMSVVMDRMAAMLKWNDLVARGYSPGKA